MSMGRRHGRRHRFPHRPERINAPMFNGTVRFNHTESAEGIELAEWDDSAEKFEIDWNK